MGEPPSWFSWPKKGGKSNLSAEHVGDWRQLIIYILS